MSEHQAELILALPSNELLAACERAAGALGWHVTQKHAAGFFCKQIAPTPMATGNPVTIEVSLSGTPDAATKIILKGRNFGFGPFQANYVKQRIQEFCTAIECAVVQPMPSKATMAGSRNVFINGVRLSDEHLNTLERTYNTRIKDGAYWYDRFCGAWGVQGGPTLGFTHTGLDVGGPLQVDASNGDTGVFINGRQLHRLDVLGLRQLGPVWPGRYWVDAMGNIGFESGMMIGNLWMLARQRQAANTGSSGGPWAVHSGRVTVMGDGQGGVIADDGNSFWSN